MAEAPELLGQALAPGQLADRELAAAEPDRLRGHDLVGQRILDHAVLVDPGLVRECVAADDRLVGLDREPGQVADQAAGRGDLLGGHGRGQLGELRRPGPEGHHDLLERRVAGALAEPVDRDLHLTRAGLDSREGVGRGEAEVVVAVDADSCISADEPDHAPDERPELGRDRVAHGVRDVDGRCAGVDDGLVDAEQEVGVRARRVLGAELDLGVAAQRRAAVPDPAHRLRERFITAQAKLVDEVDVGRGDEHVKVGPLRSPDRLDRALRIAVAAARQGGDGDAAAGLAGDPLHGLEVARRRGRKAGLDDVDPEARELASDLELLGRSQAGARSLLAVAQGRVEDAHGARRDEGSGRAWDRGAHPTTVPLVAGLAADDPFPGLVPAAA